MKKDALTRALAVLAALAVWQLAAMSVGSRILLATPWQALSRLLALLPTAGLWRTVGCSLVRISGGFLLALALGVVLALAAYRWRMMETLLRPYVVVIKSVPVASFVILALIWLGSDSLSVFIAFVMVLPVMYTGILAGMDARDEKMLEMAEVFGLSPIAKALYIYLPNAFPYTRAALCVSLGLCWKAGVAAELIGVPHGSVGEQLYFSKAYFLTADLFAWTFVIVVLSILFEKLVLLFADKAFTLFKRM